MNFNFHRNRGRHHFVDRGRVGCPLQNRDVELDQCLRCVRFVVLEERGSLPAVICDASPQGFEGIADLL